MGFELNQNYQGFAEANNVMMEDLQKALSAGYGSDSSAYTGGRSLIPESLDNTLVNVLHSQDEAKLFKALKKEPVSATVHEYTKRTGVGDEDGAWVAEGGASFEKDQALARKVITMKYLQTYRAVTLQMASVNSIEDAEAIEADAGTLWIIEQIERALYDGNSLVVAEETDGLRKLIPAANVIDLRGKTAADSEFEDAMIKGPKTIRDNFGKATQLYAPTTVFEDIQKLLRDRLRVPAGGGDKAPGAYVFGHYPTIFGNVKLDDNIFVAPRQEPRASTLTASRPGKPIFTVAKANSTSQFTTADAGTYIYKLVGVNKFGDSEESAAVTMASVVANDIVTLTVGTPSTNATGYKLYRSSKGGAASTCKLIRKVEGVTALPGTIDDTNADLPGTYDAFILTMDPGKKAMEWNQFLPLMKFQLYPTNAAVFPFLMLLFGALNLKKEEQMVRIKNVAYTGA